LLKKLKSALVFWWFMYNISLKMELEILMKHFY